MQKKSNLGVGDGFRFGVGFTLGSLFVSFILTSVFACAGFLFTTLLGGSLLSVLSQM
jgi:hypothetical protein